MRIAKNTEVDPDQEATLDHEASPSLVDLQGLQVDPALRAEHLKRNTVRNQPVVNLPRAPPNASPDLAPQRAAVKMMPVMCRNAQ